MNHRFKLKTWIALPLCLAGGALGPLSLAPFGLWPLGILSPLLLALALTNQPLKRCFLYALVFGLGLYAVGASWVFVSISQFGSTSSFLSFLLTFIFVAGLALCFALPFLAFGRWCSRSELGCILGFPAIWVIGEWMRSWFLTGFPWLYLGYGHIETWLGGWAPVFGVYGISFVVCYCASSLAWILRGFLLNKLSSQKTETNHSFRPLLKTSVNTGLAASVLCVWIAGGLLQQISWTQLSEKPISLGMAQGNIPQEEKWEPDFLLPTFKIFTGLSKELWQYDWVIWPEAAIPLFYSEAQPYINALDRKAKLKNTTFITGILYDNTKDYENTKIFNSLVAIGNGSGVTYKTRLVPFGEYVPLEQYLRGLISFFDLPTSIIHLGPKYEKGLMAGDVEIASSICYEVVYPDLVAQRAGTSGVLLTVSNDAWFGNSIGPVQHFEMAQMRALETGRYMIRSTNNGISGIIDHKGRIIVVGGRSTRESITGEIYSASGNTPFIVWRSWPIVVFCFIALALCILRAKADIAPPPEPQEQPDENDPQTENSSL